MKDYVRSLTVTSDTDFACAYGNTGKLQRTEQRTLLNSVLTEELPLEQHMQEKE